MTEISKAATTAGGGPAAEHGELPRSITWTGAFWVASGVPALVLFSIGSQRGDGVARPG